MIAGPDVASSTMTRALAHTLAALAAAAELDFERTMEDRRFFETRRTQLAPLFTTLLEAARSLEDFDLGPGMRFQARVEVGDAVLDRGVESANAKTKLALKHQSGLGARHVFGDRVTELTRARLALEPGRVLEAVNRFAELPSFPERETLVADLSARAQRQQTCLNERDNGENQRAQLVSRATKLIHEASDALHALHGALSERFPRQRDYVRSFFFETSHAQGRSVPAPAADSSQVT